MWRSFPLLERVLFLAWSNLRYSTSRLILSVGTVAAAALLMFTQIGFLDASLDSQGRVVAWAKPDLVVVSRARVSLISDVQFPMQRLVQLSELPGVRHVSPLYLDSYHFRLRNPENGRRHLVRVIGVDPPTATAFGIVPEDLEKAETVWIDRRSKSFFGRAEPGSEVEIGGKAFHVAGYFSLGTDFVNDGSVLMSRRNLQRLLPSDDAVRRLDQVDVGLVSIGDGAHIKDVVQEAGSRLPEDIEILPLQVFLDKERRFWRDHTITGFVFSLGTLVGLVVGTVICAQLLYTIVWDFRRQFATLNAIGFQRSFIIGTVACKALILAAGGFFLAWLLTHALYAELSVLTGLSFVLHRNRMLLVLTLTLLMTLIAALATVRPLLREDPAELFKD